MKIRNGFVSNSSSSSFICDVSGTDASGWDMCLEEANMYQCENGHTFLREYAVDYDERNRELDFVPEEEIVVSGAREIEIMEVQRIKSGKFTG